jgi:excisionase family DNA binding protein
VSEERELLKVSEVARVFNVSPGAVYSWVGQGKIPSYKLVGAIRLKKSDLKEWFKSKRRG